MKVSDLRRWAIIGVKDETGVGRMGQDLKRCLEPIRFLVTPSYRFSGKPIEDNEALSASNNGEQGLRAQFADLQGVIIFEDTKWALQAVRVAYEMGLKIVLVVLWEWLRSYLPEWQMCDLFVCPNRFALRVTRKLGFRNSIAITWPVNLAVLPERIIFGPARRFAHNVGLFEKDDRKGTIATLEAFSRISRPDVTLVVRVQNELPVRCDDPRIHIESRHFENHSELYKLGDVAVQPSKCEGLGFMLLEAIASGLPVITTDYPPMNEYVRSRCMLAAPRWGKYTAEQTSYIAQAHFKIPNVARLSERMAWCANHDLRPISAANRSWAQETFEPEKVRREWTNALDLVLSR